MKAAFLIGPGRVEIAEVPAPVPDRGDVLVRIIEAGICGTDYALFSGYLPAKYPIIPGHEAAGEIEAIGPGVDGLRIGERVTFQPNFSCGRCPSCLSGRENICSNKVRLGLDVDGVFAEHIKIPHNYIWPLPEELPYPAAAFTEPLAVALHGYNKSRPLPGEKILVFGTGAIGLLFVQLAGMADGEVAAFDIAGPRLEIARKLGAKRTFDSISELENEAGSFPLIYEVSGMPEALSHAVRLCAPGGRIVLTGLPEREFPVLSSLIVRKELTVLGSMIYRDEFPSAMDLLKRGDIRVEPLISDSYPLENLQQALEDFQSPTRVKTLIRIS